jgi:hypothetical protein
MRSYVAVLIGLTATAACTWLWHGPGDAVERAAQHIDREARQMLDGYEMQVIAVQAQRDPLARRVILVGPANDFQRAEMVRYAERLPGIGEARWSRPKSQFTHPLPLFGEALALALAAFTAGLLLTYALFVRKEAH